MGKSLQSAKLVSLWSFQLDNLEDPPKYSPSRYTNGFLQAACDSALHKIVLETETRLCSDAESVFHVCPHQ